jgi:pimeloyl-ACP methyl ester carboxylesterase
LGGRGKLDVEVHEGGPEKPAFIFIHGLGMDKRIWTGPGEARIMGGLLPLGLMLGGYEEPKTLYHDLREMGATVLTWSQARPVGPALDAERELLLVTGIAREIRHSGLAFICHSRGGLILRHALPRIGRFSAMVTLCTPHHGTDMARWAAYLRPLAAFLDQRLPPAERDGIRRALKRSLRFIWSDAVADLLPGSEFLGSLKDQPPKGAYCLSVGGTDPRLIKSLPESIDKILPGRVVPDEMRGGKGDGLVSARSARLPYAALHIDFHLNHAEILVGPGVREGVLRRLREHLAL